MLLVPVVVPLVVLVLLVLTLALLLLILFSSAQNWRTDVVDVGTVSSDFIKETSGGVYEKTFPVQVNKLVAEGGHDLIISVGQVVPHEVAGMANHTKNILVGTGGKEAIDQTHFLGAVYGMEKMMGRADTPCRRVWNKAWEDHLNHLPMLWVQTVVGAREAGEPVPEGADAHLAVRGLYIGTDTQCYERACELALQVNFQLMDEECTKCVCLLPAEEFHTTWLGNKAIYRTRMFMADGGDLLVLAPGVEKFGEDEGIDKLIRKYGYRTSPEVLAFAENEEDMKVNLSCAAHLIHGSSEGRFNVTYAPGKLTKEEVEGVGYNYMDMAEAYAKYDPEKLTDGWNVVDGERIFFISNPALGLWAYKGKF